MTDELHSLTNLGLGSQVLGLGSQVLGLGLENQVLDNSTV